ncbi:hypothetical protein CCMA1212_001720 [Trichoderma ghanense]|uniref:SSCRP protein n=1 Tax=Trichoderma ghanense TaxID=65468 RepID=A0ABY2HEU7_9HYPO
MSGFDLSCVFAMNREIARTAQRTCARSSRSVWASARPDIRKLSCGGDGFGLRRSPRNGNQTAVSSWGSRICECGETR